MPRMQASKQAGKLERTVPCLAIRQARIYLTLPPYLAAASESSIRSDAFHPSRARVPAARPATHAGGAALAGDLDEQPRRSTMRLISRGAVLGILGAHLHVRLLQSRKLPLAAVMPDPTWCKTHSSFVDSLLIRGRTTRDCSSSMCYPLQRRLVSPPCPSISVLLVRQRNPVTPDQTRNVQAAAPQGLVCHAPGVH